MMIDLRKISNVNLRSNGVYVLEGRHVLLVFYQNAVLLYTPTDRKHYAVLYHARNPETLEWLQNLEYLIEQFGFHINRLSSYIEAAMIEDCYLVT